MAPKIEARPELLPEYRMLYDREKDQVTFYGMSQGLKAAN
jgi:hypothetical protein